MGVSQQPSIGMFEPVRAAIAAQYEAFRAAQPTRVTGCECCTTPERLAALVAKPREDLGVHVRDTPAAWTNLRGLIRWNRETVRKKGRLANAFWEGAPEGAGVLFEWLTSQPRALAAAHTVEREDSEQYGTVPPLELWPREYRGPAS
jgi:hypothetical protein